MLVLISYEENLIFYNRIVTLVKQFMYSFDKSIKFPVAAVSALWDLESTRTSCPGLTIPPLSPGRTGTWGRLTAFASQGKTLQEFAMASSHDPTKRTHILGYSKWPPPTTSCCHVSVWAVAKAIFSNLFNRDDDLCAQHSPGLHLGSQCHK